MAGRPLNPVEIESYDVIPTDIAERVKVHRVRYIPGGYAGITLGRNILLAHPVAPDGNSALLAHELVHARQWNELGVVGFSCRYLNSFARNLKKYRRWGQAYRNIEAELEARHEATDWLRRRTRDSL